MHDCIYTEGDFTDGTFHLVRSGSVGVFRSVGGEERLINLINVNGFVGEIEVFNPGPRIGTGRVLSKTLTTYRFEKPDLSLFLSEPLLCEMLLQWISGDLKKFSDHFVKNEHSINRLLIEKETTSQNMINLILLVNFALENFPEKYSLPEKQEAYLNGVLKMFRKFLAIKLPELNYHLIKNGDEKFRSLYEENLIPKELADTLIRSIIETK